MSVSPVGPRLVFDPAAEAPTSPPTSSRPAATRGAGRAAPGGGTARAALGAFTAFYRDRLSWLALLTTSVVLCYLGGLVLFWYHAVELGEGGPQISWYAHWLLDSTFGFIALTPALLVIMPFAAWAAQRLAVSRRLVPWLYAAIGATLFALVTTPGPVAHDLIVGRGTWVADQVTVLIGDPEAPIGPTVEYSVVVHLSQQLGAALPLYLVLMALTVFLIRSATGRRRA